MPGTDQRLWQVFLPTPLPSRLHPPLPAAPHPRNLHPTPPLELVPCEGASQFSPACRDGWWESIRLISPPRTPRPDTPLGPARLTDSWPCLPQNPESRGDSLSVSLSFSLSLSLSFSLSLWSLSPVSLFFSLYTILCLLTHPLSLSLTHCETHRPPFLSISPEIPRSPIKR